MLDTQYRMHPQIMEFSSQHFYKGQLKTAEEVLQRDREEEDVRFRFIDTAGCGFMERKQAETKPMTATLASNLGHFFSMPSLTARHQVSKSVQTTRDLSSWETLYWTLR